MSSQYDKGLINSLFRSEENPNGIRTPVVRELSVRLTDTSNRTSNRELRFDVKTTAEEMKSNRLELKTLLLNRTEYMIDKMVDAILGIPATKQEGEQCQPHDS